MKKQVLVAIIVVGVLALAGANAYAQGTVSKVTVPFPFIVGETVLPAGSYVISTTPNASDVLAIRDQAGRFVASAVVQRTGSSWPETKAMFSFQKIGGRFFLAEMSIPGSSGYIVSLPKSRVASVLAKLNGAKAAPVGSAL